MTDSARLNRWDEIALEKITEMVSRKIIAGRQVTLAHVYLKRGALVPMHRHESEQMTYVLQGALRADVGGAEFTVREGEVLHVPPGWRTRPRRWTIRSNSTCSARKGRLDAGNLGIEG